MPGPEEAPPPGDVVAPAAARRRLLADLSPLRASVAYRRMWFGAVLAGVGTSVTTVAIGLQVYDLTGSTFRVGLVGLFALVPLITLGLYGGSIIDAHDRRRVIVISSSGMLLASFLLALQAWAETENLWLLYGLVVFQGCFAAVNSPARSAILPRLLPADLLPAANALSSLAMSVSLTLGPLLAGVLVAFWGFGATYAVETGMLTIALVTLVETSQST